MKRVIDIIVSLIAIIILSPIFVVISILIKLNGNGSVIFKQLRVGKDNKKFYIYKFRSMREDAPQVATNSLVNSESYVTGIGRILRKTSLDELPQLINIIKGEMSIVGPRPVIDDESEKELLRKRTEYGICHLIPGITGWAQINGRDMLSTERKIELELEYMEKQSLIFDIKIFFMTVLKVTKQEGIYEGKDDTSSKTDVEMKENVSNL